MRLWLWMACLAAALVILAGILVAPEALKEILAAPVQLMIGAPRSLEIKVLEVTGNSTPVRSASRRLLQPFGMVQLLRTFPPIAPHSEQAPPNKETPVR